MHKDYADYIDIAENLSDIVLVDGAIIGQQIKLIPMKPWAHCTRDTKTGSNCLGSYAIYVGGTTNKIVDNAFCEIDTQQDNSFMKSLTVPNTADKMVICVGLAGSPYLGGRNIYIKRLNPFNSVYGNIGQYGDNWAEFSPPYDVRGYNAGIYVSPIKGDLLLSPI
jgi:hypothetical protein